MLHHQVRPIQSPDAANAPAASLQVSDPHIPAAPPGDIVFDPSLPLARMPCLAAAGQALFREGDRRTFAYRIESGSVRQLLRHDDGRVEVIGFAFPGELVGLGFLERHATSAEAVLPSVVTPLPVAEVEALARMDEQIAERLADAVELEFGMLGERAAAQGSEEPLVRLAAYILAVAHANAVEHGNGLVVPDGVTCGFVASQLGMSIDRLAEDLATLEGRGLVTVSPFGLEVADPDGLEAVIA